MSSGGVGTQRPDPREVTVLAKETVENSLVLDVFLMARNGRLQGGRAGIYGWTRGGEEIASIRWQVEDADYLHLLYTETSGDGKSIDHSDWLWLERTPASLGGERVWFACPWCEKRVRKLYLPPSGQLFLCGGCHRLSYRSRQRRTSPGEREHQLEKELLALPPEGKPWRRKLREIEHVQDSLPYIESFQKLFLRPPKRRPGRPSKRDARERAKAEREAAKEATVKRPPGRPRLKRTYTRRKPLLVSKRKGDGEGYCVKCRDWRELQDPQPVTFKNGRPALQGTCPVCATKVARIVKAGKETAEPEAAPAALVKRPRGRPQLQRPSTRPQALLASEGTSNREGYCVKCRDWREIKGPTPVTFTNGRSALQGTCSVCGAQMTRIVKAEKTGQGLTRPSLGTTRVSPEAGDPGR